MLTCKGLMSTLSLRAHRFLMALPVLLHLIWDALIEPARKVGI
jgi:hypothetical protein